MKTRTSNICIFRHNLTLICPTCQLGKADLLRQFLHMATYSVLMSAIDYTRKIMTKIPATDAYPLWAALSQNEPQRHAGARGKPNCKCKWKKRWYKNYKWCFYTSSFSHNAALMETLHLMVINHLHTNHSKGESDLSQNSLCTILYKPTLQAHSGYWAPVWFF